MVKIIFVNAVVNDEGFGLVVNGKNLEDIISTALGTRSVSRGFTDLPKFESNCCDITITITPHDMKETIISGEDAWNSVKEMEEARQYEYEKAKKTDPEE